MAVVGSDESATPESASPGEPGAWMRPRGTARLALACLAVLAAWLANGAVPASALRERGHEFSFAFTTEGPPTAVAVDESNGDVYVARHGAIGQANCKLGCVDKYEVSGSEQKLIRAVEVPDASSIAVDNSATSPSKGDVYVAGTGKRKAKEGEEEGTAVFKFGPNGEALTTLHRFKVEKGTTEKFSEQGISGIAVGSSGELFVYTEEGLIARFDNTREKNKSLFSVAVNPLRPESEGGSLEPAPGIAVDPEGKFYLGHVTEKEGAEGKVPVVGKCEIEPQSEIEKEAECVPTTPPLPELDQQRSNGVAVNLAGNSFVTNVYKHESVVTAFTSSGAEIQRFGTPSSSARKLTAADGIAVDSSRELVYVSEGATNTVYVFVPEKPGAPMVDSAFACITTQCNPPAAGVQLVAEVDPHGLQTVAYFEYGPESCGSGTCAKTKEETLASGFGDKRLQAEPTELQPGTSYHFRVKAINADGEVAEKEGTFTVPSRGPVLLDGRAWEMVSPSIKHGLEPEPILGGGGVIQAAADGSAIAYIADGPIHAEGQAEGNRAPEPSQILAVRGSAAWGARDLATSPGEGRGPNVGLIKEYQAFTPNLGLSLLAPYPGAEQGTQWANPPLSPPISTREQQLRSEEKSYQEKTIYLHNDAPLAPEAGNSAQEQAYHAAESNGQALGNAGFLALVTEANALSTLDPYFVTGSVTQGSRLISFSGESGLNGGASPAAEVVEGQGIPPGTTLTRKKLGEWEMSAAATESSAAPEPIKLYVPFGGGTKQNVESLATTRDLSHGVFRSLKAAPGLYEWGPNSQLQLVSGIPQLVIATVQEGSQVISSVVGGGLTSGVEILSGEGIAPGTKVVREIKSGEWEISAPATSSHTSEQITVFARASLPKLGGGGDRRNAISDKGSRIFWENQPSESNSHLYVRDTQTRETLQLDVPEAGAGGGEPTAGFQVANAEGTRVFFTDTQRLTKDSRAVQSSIKPDLYVYELPPPGTTLSSAKGTLKDLTPEGIYGESAAIVGFLNYGGVLGASEDGSYVYFVANGALTAGAKPGTCEATRAAPAPEQSCNLYVMHHGSEWEAPTLIAVLSHADSPDWGLAGIEGDPGYITSRVSPKGRYLAFMSERSLTGYNNEDVTSKAAIEKNPAEQPRLDEEVFLYDSAQKTLACASCNPSGAQPEGVFDPGAEENVLGAGLEGLGLVVDRPAVWAEKRSDRWLAGSVPGWTGISHETAQYQSRYLLDNGRLFFNSPDHLVPAATGTKEKVYEFEPNGSGGSAGCHSAGGCLGLLSSGNTQAEATGERESAFLDASESGEDVFFLTDARLPAVNGTSADSDTNFDVYDARVCQQPGSSSCQSGPASGSGGCPEENACKGAAPGTPLPPMPASMTAAASGNVAHVEVLGTKVESKHKPLTAAQKLAKALKQCRSTYKGKKKRKQRSACEKRARKKYGHAANRKHKQAKKAAYSATVARLGAAHSATVWRLG
jgi:DNA-binding beta-propeller fold protein YncE